MKTDLLDIMDIILKVIFVLGIVLIITSIVLGIVSRCGFPNLSDVCLYCLLVGVICNVIPLVVFTL